MPALPNVMDLFRLDGRSALVTGGTRGLGRVMAEALAEAGASVCITSRSIDAARTAAEEIAAASGARVEGIEAEVTTADGVNRLVDVAAPRLRPRRHPRQQRRRQHPRERRRAVGIGLGHGHRYEPERRLPPVARVRPGDVRAPLGAGDQPLVDARRPSRSRAARPTPRRKRASSASRACWRSSGRRAG